MLFLCVGSFAVHFGVKGPGGCGGRGFGRGGTLPQLATVGRQPEVMWSEGTPPHVEAEETSQYHGPVRRRAAEP